MDKTIKMRDKAKRDFKTVKAISDKVKEAKLNESQPIAPSIIFTPTGTFPIGKSTPQQIDHEPDKFFDDVSLFDSAIGISLITGGLSLGMALHAMIGR